MSERLQFGAQFGVVVDFAVVYQHGVAILAAHGLLARDQVDDGEPDRAQRNVSGLENTLLVGAAMNQRRGGALDQAGLNRTVFMSESDDAAHAVVDDKWRGRFTEGRRVVALFKN